MKRFYFVAILIIAVATGSLLLLYNSYGSNKKQSKGIERLIFGKPSEEQKELVKTLIKGNTWIRTDYQKDGSTELPDGAYSRNERLWKHDPTTGMPCDFMQLKDNGSALLMLSGIRENQFNETYQLKWRLHSDKDSLQVIRIEYDYQPGPGDAEPFIPYPLELKILSCTDKELTISVRNFTEEYTTDKTDTLAFLSQNRFVEMVKKRVRNRFPETQFSLYSELEPKNGLLLKNGNPYNGVVYSVVSGFPYPAGMNEYFPYSPAGYQFNQDYAPFFRLETKHGKTEGDFIKYYPTGDTMELLQYENGIQNGKHLTWYMDSNGTYLSRAGQRIHGNFEGELIYYNNDGAIIGKCSMQNGKKHGQQIVYGIKDGIKFIRYEVKNINDKPHGKCIVRTAPDSIKEVIIYDHGKMISRN